MSVGVPPRRPNEVPRVFLDDHRNDDEGDAFEEEFTLHGCGEVVVDCLLVDAETRGGSQFQARKSMRSCSPDFAEELAGTSLERFEPVDTPKILALSRIGQDQDRLVADCIVQ